MISSLIAKALTPAVLLIEAVIVTGAPPLLIFTANGSIQPLTGLSPSSNTSGVIVSSPVGGTGGNEPSIVSLTTLLLSVSVPATPGVVGSYKEASR